MEKRDKCCVRSELKNKECQFERFRQGEPKFNLVLDTEGNYFCPFHAPLGINDLTKTQLQRKYIDDIVSKDIVNAIQADIPNLNFDFSYCIFSGLFDFDLSYKYQDMMSSRVITINFNFDDSLINELSFIYKGSFDGIRYNLSFNKTTFNAKTEKVNGEDGKVHEAIKIETDSSSTLNVNIENCDGEIKSLSAKGVFGNFIIKGNEKDDLSIPRLHLHMVPTTNERSNLSQPIRIEDIAVNDIQITNPNIYQCDMIVATKNNTNISFLDEHDDQNFCDIPANTTYRIINETDKILDYTTPTTYVINPKELIFDSDLDNNRKIEGQHELYIEGVQNKIKASLADIKYKSLQIDNINELELLSLDRFDAVQINHLEIKKATINFKEIEMINSHHLSDSKCPSGEHV